MLYRTALKLQNQEFLKETSAVALLRCHLFCTTAVLNEVKVVKIYMFCLFQVNKAPEGEQQDVFPPSPVRDLRAVTIPENRTILFSFRAPGDDYDEGIGNWQ